MLKDLLARMKAEPAIKLALGRGAQPAAQDIYDALNRLLADEEFEHFVLKAQIWDRKCLAEPCEDRRQEWYIRFAKETATMMSRAARGTLSASARKDVVKWCNHNGYGLHLQDDTQQELSLIETCRPTEHQVLYRGMLFQDWQLKKPLPGRDESLKSARIFVEALRHGHTEVLARLSSPSSWTTRSDVADRFARKRSAQSSHGAMMNWIKNADRFIEGRFGILLAGAFIPRDILAEIARLDLGHLNHGDEGEMIVMPGDYDLTIKAVYTPAGPIDPEMFAAWLNSQSVE